jgi:hypothetical protein
MTTPEPGRLPAVTDHAARRRIPVTTDTSLVVSRHVSPYSTGYNSPLPTIVSFSRYANKLFLKVLQAASGIMKPAVQVSLHHLQTEGA